MRIKLLGTGSAEGLPALFCSCQICGAARKTGGKNHRTRASALIDDAFKVDLPPDTMHHVLAQGLDLPKIRCLFITHTHDDHFALQELQYMSWMFVTEEWTRKLPVYGPPDAIDKIKSQLELEILPLDLHTLKPWQAITVEDWKVTPILANHAEDRVCFNHIVERDGKSLLYATDTGWYHDETWEFLAGRKLNGLVIECAKGLDENGYKAHMSIPEVIRLKEKMIETGALTKDSVVVSTHHSHLSGLLHEQYETHLNPHGIQVGHDGMTFEV
jgi:phosphoribosyl 1,2-cyclic phosphate phosphodiesterase